MDAGKEVDLVREGEDDVEEHGDADDDEAARDVVPERLGERDDERRARDDAREHDDEPADPLDGRDAEGRRDQERRERVAVEAVHLDGRELALDHEALQQPHEHGHDGDEDVEHRRRDADLVEVVGPVRARARPPVRNVLGKVARDAEQEQDRRRDPERPVQVRVALDALKERLPDRHQAREAPREHVPRVDVKVRPVEARLPEVVPPPLALLFRAALAPRCAVVVAIVAIVAVIVVPAKEQVRRLVREGLLRLCGRALLALLCLLALLALGLVLHVVKVDRLHVVCGLVVGKEQRAVAAAGRGGCRRRRRRRGGRRGAAGQRHRGHRRAHEVCRRRVVLARVDAAKRCRFACVAAKHGFLVDWLCMEWGELGVCG